MSENDVSAAWVMSLLDELKSSFVRLDEKLDVKLGDHATRITKLEVEGEHKQRQIDALLLQQQNNTAGRRWVITTAIAVIAVLVSIAAVAAAVLGG
ncbi:hypothetical protein SK571_13480 [Lentzea sp. BCCO 10_0798]|uniref:Haemolysin XhlA n=1 Tax=Lentzea kristufekii TaxID=3095430 RepID=A0ABU4TR50_9PSEU|nr:hypothetical protein [Lentzea sp. BCCO 10_0798]MDX8050397.1 hypothetical protein [Lentzea sp. BCCO 10_0798]